MNKRDAVLTVLDYSKPQEYIPAGFFLHFGGAYQTGAAAVDKHLEYFRATGMDFVKIQFELKYPRFDWIRRPEDWERMPSFGGELFGPQLEVVERLVKAAKAEAVVFLTLYSPFMFACHLVDAQMVTAHMAENPGAVNKGMQIITDSMMGFVQDCIRVGIDGFYHSTQGYESERFQDKSLFLECIKPYDLQIMSEVNRQCPFNVLHVCDYHGGYDDLDPLLDYPGHVVNCNPHVGGRELSGVEISQLFGRPFMGGMDRKGVLATGGEEEIRAEARAVLSDAPDRFILAADCTVPGDTPWSNLSAAIDEAHRWKR